LSIVSNLVKKKRDDKLTFLLFLDVETNPVKKLVKSADFKPLSVF